MIIINNKHKKVYSGIGGQAVLEGIMMKNKNEYAVAIRKPDGNIEVKKDIYIMMSEKIKPLSLPFIRGIFSMIDSLILGSRILEYSASFIEGDEGVSETKLDKWLNEHLNDKSMKVLTGIITVISFVIALIIFSLVPAFIGQIVKRFNYNDTISAVVEGFSRIGIFVAYVKLISNVNDIKRTFQYHGSEHKCINCIENGLDLTVDNVMISSKEHKRCGTSFLVIVMIISIFLFMFLKFDNIWIKFLSRILLIPFIAGVSYEMLRFMGKFDNKFVDIISRPGMWMQGLTTLEPDRDQVEVAIKAVEEVFDWKRFKEDNFKNV